MTHPTTLAPAGTSYTAIGILLAVLVPICAAAAVIVWNYYRLQRHRADAVAMAAYRKLAEEGSGASPRWHDPPPSGTWSDMKQSSRLRSRNSVA